MTKEELSKQYANERRIPNESRASVQFNCFDIEQAYEDGFDKAVGLACEWMKENVWGCIYLDEGGNGMVDEDKLIDNFKKDMEKGI